MVYIYLFPPPVCKQSRWCNDRNKNERDTRNKCAFIMWCEYMDAYACRLWRTTYLCKKYTWHYTCTYLVPSIYSALMEIFCTCCLPWYTIRVLGTRCTLRYEQLVYSYNYTPPLEKYVKYVYYLLVFYFFPSWENLPRLLFSVGYVQNHTGDDFLHYLLFTVCTINTSY